LIVDSANASFFIYHDVANTLFVWDAATVWGMMSPSQSDYEDEELMTDRPLFDS
jgi:hypothetical protein